MVSLFIAQISMEVFVKKIFTWIKNDLNPPTKPSPWGSSMKLGVIETMVICILLLLVGIGLAQEERDMAKEAQSDSTCLSR